MVRFPSFVTVSTCEVDIGSHKYCLCRPLNNVVLVCVIGSAYILLLDISPALSKLLLRVDSEDPARCPSLSWVYI